MILFIKSNFKISSQGSDKDSDDDDDDEEALDMEEYLAKMEESKDDVGC